MLHLVYRKRKREGFIPKTKAIKGFWVSPPSLPWRQNRRDSTSESVTHARSRCFCCCCCRWQCKLFCVWDLGANKLTAWDVKSLARRLRARGSWQHRSEDHKGRGKREDEVRTRRSTECARGGRRKPTSLGRRWCRRRWQEEAAVEEEAGWDRRRRAPTRLRHISSPGTR